MEVMPAVLPWFSKAVTGPQLGPAQPRVVAAPLKPNQPNWADIRGKLLVSTSGAMTRCSWGEKNWRYKWDFHQIPNRLGSPFDYGILWVSMV